MADIPRRIQRKRTKGWRMPPNTVSVTRPGKFGNPFTVEEAEEAGYTNGREMAVYGFRQFLRGDPIFASHPPARVAARQRILDSLHDLRGKNLACFCALCERHKDGKPFGESCTDCAPCHADPLGELANSPEARAA